MSRKERRRQRLASKRESPRSTRGDRTGSPQPPIRMVPRDVPVVEEGFRIVGPAQAMVDYARPLIEQAQESDDPEGLQQAMELAQLLWNLAVAPPAEQKKIRAGIRKNLDFPEVDLLIDMMIERHHQMFPDLLESPGFYIRERVIDEVEEFEPFDESTLELTAEPLPPSEEEVRLAQVLADLDAKVEAGSDWGDYEKAFLTFQKGVEETFEEWCVAQGAPPEVANCFALAVDSFLHFVYGYGQGTLATVSLPTIREFMTSFFIRKTWADPEVMSAMPTGLKLFFRYLEEKGMVGKVWRKVRAVERYREAFLENLQDFNNP